MGKKAITDKVRLGEVENTSNEEMAVWDNYERIFVPVPAGHTADVEFTNGKQRVLGVRPASKANPNSPRST